MAAKTESHRKFSERMSSARAKASAQVMSRAEFLAQTPTNLRIAAARGNSSDLDEILAAVPDAPPLPGDERK
jgi:hypothetical protein